MALWFRYNRYCNCLSCAPCQTAYDRFVLSKQSDWKPVTSGNISVSNTRKLIQFFIKPNLKIEDKHIKFARYPHLLKPQFTPEQMDVSPRIEAQIDVVNRGYTRAEDSHGELALIGKTNLRMPCIWAYDRSRSGSVPSGLVPTLLVLFQYDPLNCRCILDDEKHDFQIIPKGAYNLTLTLDAQGLGGKDIDLGIMNFPDDVLRDTTSFDYYREACGDTGYAIFLEKSSGNKLKAKVIGKIADERLMELKQKLSAFDFEYV